MSNRVGAMRCRHRPSSGEPFCFVCLRRVPIRQLAWAGVLDVEPVPLHEGCIGAFVQELQARFGVEVRPEWVE
jgi:hypothetical protein